MLSTRPNLRIARRNGAQPPAAAEVTIRLATAADAPSLTELARLDSRRPLGGELLVADAAGTPVAAMSLADGRTIADPFVPTGAIVSLLELRAAQLRSEGRRERGARAPRVVRALPSLARR